MGPPEILVFWIDPGGTFPLLTLLLVGCREQDQPVQVLDAPSRVDQLGRQPVQQLWVRWGSPHGSKVIRCGNDAVTHVVMPEPVHEDASGERVLGGGEPVGQCPAAAGGFTCRKGDGLDSRGRFDLGGDQHARKRGMDLVEVLAWFTTIEHVRQRYAARRIDRCHHGQGGLRPAVGKLCQLLLDLPELDGILGNCGDGHVDRFFRQLENPVGLGDQPRLVCGPLRRGFPDRCLHRGGQLCQQAIGYLAAVPRTQLFKPAGCLVESVLPLFQLGSMLLLLLLAGHRHIDRLRGCKKRLQAEVVLLGEGVELVVVAACTGDRQSQEGGADVVGHLGQYFLAVLLLILHAGVEPQGPQSLHPGGYQGFHVGGVDLVTCHLLADEPLKGLVRVQ